jgi:hypothetical protein
MRTTLDVAYACFLTLGIGILATGIGALLHLPFAHGSTEFGFWFAASLSIVLLVALGFSVALWGHGPMRLLALLTLLFLGTSMLVDVAVTPGVVYAVGGLYAVIATVLSLRWFVVGRPGFHQP